GQCRAEFPRRHQEREVPRDDLADYADWLADSVGVIACAGSVWDGKRNGVALDLGGPSGHVAEQLRGQGNVSSACHGKWLSVVERLKLGEFFKVLVDQIPKFPDQLSTLGSCHLAPWTVESGAS